jgi:hypothetical protein
VVLRRYQALTVRLMFQNHECNGMLFGHEMDDGKVCFSLPQALADTCQEPSYYDERHWMCDVAGPRLSEIITGSLLNPRGRPASGNEGLGIVCRSPCVVNVDLIPPRLHCCVISSLNLKDCRVRWICFSLRSRLLRANCCHKYGVVLNRACESGLASSLFLLS